MRSTLRSKASGRSPNQALLELHHVILYRNGDIPFRINAESMDHHDRSEFIDQQNSRVVATS